jgi:hypothetical protein
MTRPELFAADCAACAWGSGAAELADAEQLAGSHDDREHGGIPTAWIAPAPDQPDAQQERRAE